VVQVVVQVLRTETLDLILALAWVEQHNNLHPQVVGMETLVEIRPKIEDIILVLAEVALEVLEELHHQQLPVEPLEVLVCKWILMVIIIIGLVAAVDPVIILLLPLELVVLVVAEVAHLLMAQLGLQLQAVVPLLTVDLLVAREQRVNLEDQVAIILAVAVEELVGVQVLVVTVVLELLYLGTQVVTA
tara:strand:- start:104 stop:667 length:564 start_codon:yes stop_codon:yes gene_type:complete